MRAVRQRCWAAVVPPPGARGFSRKRIAVIVADDVEGLGSKGEVLSVKPGHARNHLFPRKMAVYATDVNRIRFAQWTQSLDLEKRAEEQRRRAAIARIETVTVRVKRQVVASDPVSGVDQPHAPVSAAEVVKALWRQHYIALEEERLEMPAAGIDAYGVHSVPVRLGQAGQETKAQLQVRLDRR